MSTLTSPGPAAEAADPASRPPADGGGPGITTIADSVVEKIAGRAAAEIDDVGGPAGRVLGLSVGPGPGQGAPRARARVDGTLVLLEIELSVRYPAPIGAVTERVRRHVAERVAELTGLSVRQVDVSVGALYRPLSSGRVVA